MSYDIRIINKKTKRTVNLSDSCYPEIDVRGFEDYGGTMMIGEKESLSTNMTYNYYPFLEKVLGKNGVRSLYGIKMSSAERKLNNAIKTLKNADTTSKEWIYEYPKHTKKEKDEFYKVVGIPLEEPQGYWRCTVPNVLKALEHLKFLVDLAKKLNPDGYNEDFVIDGD